MEVFEVTLSGCYQTGIGIVASDDSAMALKVFEEYFFRENDYLDYDYCMEMLKDEPDRYKDVWAIVNLEISVKEIPQLSFIGEVPKVLSEQHHFE